MTIATTTTTTTVAHLSQGHKILENNFFPSRQDPKKESSWFIFFPSKLALRFVLVIYFFLLFSSFCPSFPWLMIRVSLRLPRSFPQTVDVLIGFQCWRFILLYRIVSCRLMACSGFLFGKTAIPATNESRLYNLQEDAQPQLRSRRVGIVRKLSKRSPPSLVKGFRAKSKARKVMSKKRGISWKNSRLMIWKIYSYIYIFLFSLKMLVSQQLFKTFVMEK